MESNTESGFEDSNRNDRKRGLLDAINSDNTTEEIDTNLVAVDENETENLKSRKLLAKKIEIGEGDFNVIYDVNTIIAK